MEWFFKKKFPGSKARGKTWLWFYIKHIIFKIPEAAKPPWYAKLIWNLLFPIRSFGYFLRDKSYLKETDQVIVFLDRSMTLECFCDLYDIVSGNYRLVKIEGEPQQ